jgi:hypothetical protein
MLEFDGACWAKASASFSNSRGTGWGKNSRVEWRSPLAVKYHRARTRAFL